MRTRNDIPVWTRQPAVNLSRAPIVQLIRRIALGSDAACLEEVHRRPLFVGPDGRRVMIVGLIAWLRDSATRQEGAEIADRAYDLTVSKFSSIPEGQPGDSWPAKQQKRKPVACRYYFRALAEHLEATGVCSNPAGVAAENRAVHAFRRLIFRHFRLSLHEARRQAGWTRYLWKSPANGAVTVFMPRSLNGIDRGKWLDSNIPEFELRAPEAARRVQDIINDRLGDLDSTAMADVCHGRPAPCPHESIERVTADGLGRTVAAEKADAIHEQRPAIRALGAETLRELVEHIFDRLADGHFADIEIAREYDLSKATFSRFCGSRWDRNGAVGNTIPDLWANAAEVLAANPLFVEAAQRAGVWGRVLALVECRPGNEGGNG